jgi:hypothetical protein
MVCFWCARMSSRPELVMSDSSRTGDKSICCVSAVSSGTLFGTLDDLLWRSKKCRLVLGRCENCWREWRTKNLLWARNCVSRSVTILITLLEQIQPTFSLAHDETSRKCFELIIWKMSWIKMMIFLFFRKIFHQIGFSAEAKGTIMSEFLWLCRAITIKREWIGVFRKLLYQ